MINLFEDYSHEKQVKNSKKNLLIAYDKAVANKADSSLSCMVISYTLYD